MAGRVRILAFLILALTIPASAIAAEMRASTASQTRVLFPTAADRLVAPDTVTANADGSFHYLWTFYKGTGSAVIASFGWTGMHNVAGGLVADCFCDPQFCLISEGDSLPLFVDGQLTNPAQSGEVTNYASFCSSQGRSSSTTILPHTSTAVGDLLAEVDLSLSNEPNPFSRRTAFRYHLPELGLVSLAIYDLSGRRVATIVDQAQSAGHHTAVWDVDRASVHVSGVFFARLKFAGQVRTRRVVITE